MASSIATKKIAFSSLGGTVPIGLLVSEVEKNKSNDGGKQTHYQKHEPALRCSSFSTSERISRFEDFRGQCVPEPEVRAPAEALPQHAINLLRSESAHDSSHQQCANL